MRVMDSKKLVFVLFCILLSINIVSAQVTTNPESEKKVLCVGEEFSVGGELYCGNGEPVQGEVKLSISPSTASLNTNTVVPMGGLYIFFVTASQAGEYIITATAQAPCGKGEKTRSASSSLTVHNCVNGRSVDGEGSAGDSGEEDSNDLIRSGETSIITLPEDLKIPELSIPSQTGDFNSFISKNNVEFEVIDIGSGTIYVDGSVKDIETSTLSLPPFSSVFIAEDKDCVSITGKSKILVGGSGLNSFMFSTYDNRTSDLSFTCGRVCNKFGGGSIGGNDCPGICPCELAENKLVTLVDSSGKESFSNYEEIWRCGGKKYPPIEEGQGSTIVPYDSDGDGVSDYDEKVYKSNPNDKENTPESDNDGDGYSNYEEWKSRTDPNNKDNNPLTKDSDGDGFSDVTEKQYSSNPNYKEETPFSDNDGDGYSNMEEIDEYKTNPNDYQSRPISPSKDEDGDGFSNGDERYYGSDFFDPKETPKTDRDGDGFLDVVEKKLGTNPNDNKDNPNIDTDGDTIPDFVENKLGSNPNDKKSFPQGMNPPPDPWYQPFVDWGEKLKEIVQSALEGNSQPSVGKAVLTMSDEEKDKEKSEEESLLFVKICRPKSSGVIYPVSELFVNKLPPRINDDSDEDKLYDLEEYIFMTHPKKKDTDGDGIDDLSEIKVGANPLERGTTVLDSKEVCCDSKNSISVTSASSCSYNGGNVLVVDDLKLCTPELSKKDKELTLTKSSRMRCGLEHWAKT